MKAVIIFLSCIVISIAEQSIYPIEYTFNDNGFFIQSIKKPSKQDNMPIILQNTMDEYLIVEDRLIELPICNIIRTINDLNEYKKNNFTPCTKLFSLIYSKEVMSINLEKFNIVVYQNSDASVHTAAIFKQNAFIGIMHTNINLIDFSIILKTLKDNVNKLKLQDFIDNAKIHIDKREINLALKNLISALIINSTNIEAKLLLSKVFSLQETMLVHNKNTLSEL